MAGYLVDMSGGVQVLAEPQRVFDSRNGPKPAAGSTSCLTLAGQSGVPGSASAALVNVASVFSTGLGWLTVFPAGQPLPPTSTVNFDQTAVAVANGTIVPLGSGGQACVYVARSLTDFVVDLIGYVN
ncbi:MAG: hypothetical protein JOZ81_02915 [Chloroflexi bacterium]|nr:hypothetical protein [Chloroflexota bacterium]